MRRADARRAARARAHERPIDDELGDCAGHVADKHLAQGDGGGQVAKPSHGEGGRVNDETELVHAAAPGATGHLRLLGEWGGDEGR
jgi:hypothetical protein